MLCVCAHMCAIVFALMCVIEREEREKAKTKHRMRGFHCLEWGDYRKSKKLSRAACLSFPLNHSVAGACCLKMPT